jgi:probable rRNA maturation factor
MELDIEINNLSKSPVKKYFLKNIFRKVFQRVELEFFEKKKVSLSVALVSSGEIRKLNKIYRKKNLTTDVLSFCEFESKKRLWIFLKKKFFSER